ncbi:MAG: hypothetical protein ACE5LB_14255 [Acidiferrobacterales bacterium]
MRLIRLAIIVGFIIAAIGLLIALPAEDRSLGFVVFMVGFLIAAGGIVANAFSIPSSSKAQPVLPGLKIAAIGFGIAAIGGGTSAMLNREGLSDIFFYIGFAVLVIGILFSIFGIARSNR